MARSIFATTAASPGRPCARAACGRAIRRMTTAAGASSGSISPPDASRCSIPMDRTARSRDQTIWSSTGTVASGSPIWANRVTAILIAVASITRRPTDQASARWCTRCSRPMVSACRPTESFSTLPKPIPGGSGASKSAAREPLPKRPFRRPTAAACWRRCRPIACLIRLRSRPMALSALPRSLRAASP